MTKAAEDALIAETLIDGVLTLTLGAGTAHALSSAMLAAFNAALKRAGGNDAVRVIVIHGPGHIFCAGHDLKEIAKHRTDADDGKAYLRQLFDDCAEAMQRLTKGPKPTVAMVDGIATAAGLQIVAACDLAFASDRATFCLPGVNNGGFCSTPAVAVGRAMSRKHAMEMALSGAVYDARWAQDAGLLNRVTSSADLSATVYDFTKTLSTRHGPAISSGKQTFYDQIEQPLGQAYETATETMLGHFMDPLRIAEERKTWGDT
ncbi:Enoyl-CoA hydratase/carnithine racemase [Shimia gijangensis]|uniref:Enoyl-CoA hydratase/carnithine racemase n=1 Tax=Shimia gijangensis TaxID=1470563 RepID=A0A1M6E720_9RHOB|nr:enoyl-CoA hydratase-related protein [Shimia gijangensis]SHI81225.1 Enoyl-CoA hydratase/carnithine racemase [Shimia gijangensis]